MRSIEEVLKQKERQLAMVKREIEALELVIAMLKDDEPQPAKAENPPGFKHWP